MNKQTVIPVDDCPRAALDELLAATISGPVPTAGPDPGSPRPPVPHTGADGESTTHTTPPRVLGIDLSLRSTGIASSLGWTRRITSAGHRDDTLDTRRARLRAITDEIDSLAKDAHLAVIEGPSYASATSSAGTWDRGGAWWLVVDRLMRRAIPVAVVPPSVRCRYACGKGNASKDQVLTAVVRRFPGFDVDGNDVADAVVLAALGADWLGSPIVAMPQAHRDAVGSAQWPELETVQARIGGAR